MISATCYKLSLDFETTKPNDQKLANQDERRGDKSTTVWGSLQILENTSRRSSSSLPNLIVSSGFLQIAYNETVI